MNYIKGPDLPTGGVLIGKNSMISAYETGEGKVTCRAKTSIEKLENGRLGIVITEFPYRRNKAKLLQTISEMTGDKRHQKALEAITDIRDESDRSGIALEAITDIRDESDRSGIRAVIELKKAADETTADKILKYLFKKTDLQCNISFNMVALADGKPETMGLKTILGHYINHQKEIVTRRTRKELEIAEKRFHIVEGFIKAINILDEVISTIREHYINHQKEIVTRRTRKELEIAEKRFHIVEGFIKAINILDEVISTIRESKSKKDAGENLINKFGFTEAQATAILELMLYRLTGLEINVFQKEYKELERQIKKFKKILSEEKELLKVVKFELKEITDKYRNPRRTQIVEDDSEAKIDLEELIVVEDVMLTISKDGFIKRIPYKNYIRNPRRTQIVEDDSEAKIDLEELIVVEDVMLTISKDGFIKRIPYKNYIRANAEPSEIEYREGDELRFLVKSNTTDNILIFTDRGIMYQIKGINVPEGKWKEKGEKLDTLIKALNLDEEKIIGVNSVNVMSSDRFVQFVTNSGCIKRSSLDKFQTNYSKVQAVKLRDGERCIKRSSLDKFQTNYSKVQAVKLREGERVVRTDILEGENKFLKISTKLGLEFTLEIPQLEDLPRNILGTQLFNLSSKDEVINAEYVESMEFVEYTLGVTAKGTLKTFARANKNDSLKVTTDSSSELLMFTNKGNVIKIASFMLQEAIKNSEISIYKNSIIYASRSN